MDLYVSFDQVLMALLSAYRTVRFGGQHHGPGAALGVRHGHLDHNLVLKIN